MVCIGHFGLRYVRLISEQIKARLEVVGVSKVDVSTSSLNCASACASLLLLHQVSSSMLFYLTCTHMHSNVCVHVCMCAFAH